MTSSITARGRKRFARAVACGALVALPSCIPDLRPAAPAPPLPPDFRGVSSPQDSALLGVQDFYEDPLLVCLIEQAMAGNQELKMLNEDIRIASNEVLARRGAYLPFIGLRGDAGLDRHSLYTPLGAAEDQLTYPGGGHFPDPVGNFRLSADVFWRIDLWREFRNARDAAGQRYLAAVERRNDFVIRLVAEVAGSYFELLALDQRLLILDQVIALQEQSLRVAELTREAGRSTDLPVQRFRAEVRKNQSEKLIVTQDIIETENRINFLRGVFPQPVERNSAGFLDLNLQALQVGIPAQLLQYRPDIRQAERELASAGLEVKVARAHFYPRLDITASVGWEAFNPRYLFNPDALIGNLVGGLVVPVVNRNAIQADYGTANARQLQAVYEYQRIILNAFAEVVNNLTRSENYRRSVDVKRQQLDALNNSVDVAMKLFQADRADYVDVLFAQRDLLDARTVIVQTKQEQLAAVVTAYRALGGGLLLSSMNGMPGMADCPPPLAQPGGPGGPAVLPPPPAPALPPDAAGGAAAPADAVPADGVPADGAPAAGDMTGRAAVTGEPADATPVDPSAADPTVGAPNAADPTIADPTAAPAVPSAPADAREAAVGNLYGPVSAEAAGPATEAFGGP